MGPRDQAVAALEARIGWSFQDRALLERALTHASAAKGGKKLRDNERLEFLGDRVLGLLTADRLTREFPEASEGELTPRLHALVNRRACARAAREAGLGPALRLAPGEAKQGGRDNDTVLGDACEALLGALYLDAGLERTGEIWADLWAGQFSGPPAVDPDLAKTRLQEWAQAKGYGLPRYEVLHRTGPDHAPQFRVRVTVGALGPEEAEAGARQQAEKLAAAALLERERA